MDVAPIDAHPAVPTRTRLGWTWAARHCPVPTPCLDPTLPSPGLPIHGVGRCPLTMSNPGECLDRPCPMEQGDRSSLESRSALNPPGPNDRRGASMLDTSMCH